MDAAHREVFEETGLKIEIMSLVNVSTNHINTNLHTIAPVLTASVVGGVLKPGDDLVELDWISKYDTLPEMAFEADEYKIVSKRLSTFFNSLFRHHFSKENLMKKLVEY